MDDQSCCTTHIDTYGADFCPNGADNENEHIDAVQKALHFLDDQELDITLLTRIVGMFILRNSFFLRSSATVAAECLNL